MNPYNLELYRTTYELESNKYPPLEETKNILYKTSHERLSSSPPIILCETNNSRNNKYHRHRYLFYPSASRLSPFSNNDNNINTIKNAINDNEQKDKNEKSPEKYQSMYDKSFELVKRISELVPLEDIKIKGNSEYYLNKDQDYMNIVDKEINTLTNHFKNNNINFGYNSEGNLNKNNNYLNNNDTDKKNMTYDQYKNSLLQKIQDSKNENQNFEQNDEKPYNDINNINNSNRNYINDYLNSKDNKKQENVEINQPEIKEENNNLNNKYRNKKDNIKNNIDNNMNKDTLKEKEDEQIKNNMNDNKIPQYNTLGMIQNDNNNDNTNKKNNQNNNIKNNITNQKSKIPYTLIDENNDKILSLDNKPFTGELISNQYQKGNQIFIRTKTGSDIKLNILRGKEGEPLCYKGYPLMGTSNKFFYDKDGNVIAYPDNEFIKGDKAIDVRILDNKNIKDFGVSNNFEINEGTGNSMGSIGEVKKIKMKSKWYMFPKGNGSAKAPVIKKKKKKNKI